ncbi:DUF4097 family beta strand repeat-containing protein [Kitasatospora sp. NPDC001539]|uniref:DUF4097 family beta strand repeat-containing protein n=1 Tax=unclassified Kitasatospora TaxID=2633591 RepID=UPI00333169AE
MKRVLGAVAITAAVVLGMQGCVGFWESDEHRTVSYGVAERISELVVDGESGGVVVIGGGDSVGVVEEQSYRGEAPQSRHEVKDGVLTLGYACDSCGVGYTVRVPAGTKVRIREGNGGVRLSGLAAEVDAAVENGGVEATGMTSPTARLSATNGGVRAEFTAAPTTLDAEVGDGGVRLTVPGGEAYAVDARTDSGGTDVGIRSQPGAAHRITAVAKTGGVTVSGG